MVSQKRALDDSSSTQKAKKRKGQDGDKAKDSTKKTQTQEHQPLTRPAASLLNAEEIDFPRGGGSSLTALEVKAIRAEGAKEVEDLFKENEKKQKNKSGKKSKVKTADAGAKSDKIRIEHLNYKRLDVGMKIMGQIVGILPLTLLVSLPNQLLGHIPITNISPQFTRRLEQIDEDEDMESSDSDSEDGEESSPKLGLPELSQMFSVGQYVRAAVTAVFQGGASDPSGLHRSRDELAKLCRRVELSLAPNLVNEGVKVEDLKGGFTLTASVRSVEDHGYILDLGVPNADGFLSFKDPGVEENLSVGQLCNVTVSKLAANKRTCEVTARPTTFQTAVTTEVSSVTSVLPGALVQGLVLDTGADGINLQLLGFFDGTADRIHLRKNSSPVKVGRKVKGRVLYQYSKEPPRFAVALSEYLSGLKEQEVSIEGSEDARSLKEAYPLGHILESVKVTKVEPERGVYLEVAPGVEGFAHISHMSDDHLPSVSTSGPYKLNTYHRARVTGHHAFDGLLQLSLKPSIFEHKFLQLSDFKAGEIVKGTIKSVNDTALFVSLSGNIDGVIWPNHFADIRLKHPARRFKVGNPIKVKVLVVDAERKRISLTAKKTLLDSDLPVLSSLDDVKVGVITHAVVFRVTDKAVMVEFFNNLKASIPLKEASDTPNVKLADAFPVGRVVKVRIQSVDKSQNRISASVRQALASKAPVIVSVDEVEIGDVASGVVQEVHAENIVLSLKPTNVRALLSIKNLANHRKLTPAQIHQSTKAGETLEELVVLTKNAEKGIVIVANKPKTRPALPSKGQLSIDTIQPGQRVGGRVVRHTRQGTLIKITNNIGGILHPTDTADEYNVDKVFPAVDTLVTATVVSVEKDKRQLVLSTRASRENPDQEHNVVDREIATISDLHVGDSLRGFIKNIANHGLFVTIGRGIDARVQIRELFDEFVKEWKPRFKEHQLVKGRILSVDAENNQVEMTFKSGDLSRGKNSQADSVKEGQKVSGVIKRVEPYGLFIDIKNSRLHGLCHKSQLSDNAEADVDEALRTFRLGDLVKAVVLKAEKGRISLSLKPSLFEEGDFEQEQEDASDSDNDDEAGGPIESDEEAGDRSGDEDEPMRDYTMADSDGEDEDDETMMIDMDQTSLGLPHATTPKPPTVQPSTSAPSLTLKGGFQWFDQNAASDDEDDDASSSEGSDNEGITSKRTKKKKRKEIQQDLTADMHTKRPESNSDFERLLLGSPNSSYLWIQYMSFQLQISEIDKAREIAKRAIETINFREEQERLNVWIALLNLENVYGTEESLENVFKDAARANDSKTVHLRLAAIFDQSGKPEKAEQQFQRTCKKFGKSSKVWTLFGEFYLRQGKLEEARKLLPRSLQSLEKRKHLKTISRFAQLEYKLGDAERGRTLFEGIIDSHPKRWDLWSIYMDMEGVQQNIQAIRNLFDRILSLKMTSHKAKSFFKKWLDLEKRIGDEEGIENVKKKAVEWTQNAASTSSSS